MLQNPPLKGRDDRQLHHHRQPLASYPGDHDRLLPVGDHHAIEAVVYAVHPNILVYLRSSPPISPGDLTPDPRTYPFFLSTIITSLHPSFSSDERSDLCSLKKSGLLQNIKSSPSALFMRSRTLFLIPHSFRTHQTGVAPGESRVRFFSSSADRSAASRSPTRRPSASSSSWGREGSS